MEYPSNRDQEASSHGIAEILAGSAQKQYSQLLAGTACCMRRPIHNAHQTHSHSSVQSMLVFGSKKACALCNHISDLIVGAKESNNAPLSFPEQATHEECQGYTLYSQLILQALLKTKISASNQNEPSEQLKWVTLI